MNLSKQPPLFLPKGSVRSLLALLVVGAIVWSFLAYPTKTTETVAGTEVVTESREFSDTQVLLIVGVLGAYGAMRLKQQEKEPTPLFGDIHVDSATSEYPSSNPFDEDKRTGVNLGEAGE
jgi:hypothetical protein